MKTIFLFAMCLALFAVAPGQERDVNLLRGEVSPPEFNGKNFEMLLQGKTCSSLNEYLLNCLVYPEECIRKETEGTEVIEFVVTPEGTLTAFNVLNSLAPEIDEHVICMLKNTSGMWTPGKINNQVVPMKKEISVVYKYNEFANMKTPDFFSIAGKHFKKGCKQLFVQHKPAKALRSFNNGIRYQPKDESLLMMRGICRYELGDEDGARQDWDRMKALENKRSEFQHYAEKLKDYKGYDELSLLIDK